MLFIFAVTRPSSPCHRDRSHSRGPPGHDGYEGVARILFLCMSHGLLSGSFLAMLKVLIMRPLHQLSPPQLALDFFHCQVPRVLTS